MASKQGACTAQPVRAARRLRAAYGTRNRITSQAQYAFFALCNMLKAASLFFFFLENTFTNWASVKNSLEAFGTMPSSYLEYSKTKILLILLENLWVATQVTTVSYISLLAPIGYRRTTPNLSPLTAHRHNLGYGRATEIQPKHQTENIALPYVSWWLLAIILPSY